RPTRRNRTARPTRAQPGRRLHHHRRTVGSRAPIPAARRVVLLAPGVVLRSGDRLKLGHDARSNCHGAVVPWQRHVPGQALDCDDLADDELMVDVPTAVGVGWVVRINWQNYLDEIGAGDGTRLLLHHAHQLANLGTRRASVGWRPTTRIKIADDRLASSRLHARLSTDAV